MAMSKFHRANHLARISVMPEGTSKRSPADELAVAKHTETSAGAVSQPPSNQVDDCHLLALPAELRTRIFELVIYSPYTVPFDDAHPPNLTLTCHQIRSEALPLYWGSNRFYVTLGWSTIFWRPHNVLSPPRESSKSGQRLQSVKHLESHICYNGQHIRCYVDLEQAVLSATLVRKPSYWNPSEPEQQHELPLIGAGATRTLSRNLLLMSLLETTDFLVAVYGDDEWKLGRKSNGRWLHRANEGGTRSGSSSSEKIER